MLFLETIAPSLMSVHGLLAGVAFLCLMFSFGYVVLREEPEWRKGRIYGIWGSIAYIFTFVLGLLIYPVFRIKVRAYDFDVARQWATGMFEIKEHLSSFVLFAVIGILLLSLVKMEHYTRATKKLYASLITVSFLLTATIAVIGLVLVSVRSI